MELRGGSSAPTPTPSTSGTGKAVKQKPDTASLRPPIKVSVTGMKQAIQALEFGSPEVQIFFYISHLMQKNGNLSFFQIKNCLLHECNLIYECKICLSMFRSLANLIAHKRSFCRKKICEVRHCVPPREGDEPFATESTVMIQAEEPPLIDTVPQSSTFDLEEYNPTMELLKDAGVIEEIEARPLIQSLNTKKPEKSFCPKDNRL